MTIETPAGPCVDIIARAMAMGANWAAVIDPRVVVTGDWIRLKCQYGCLGYGRLVCPPYAPDAIIMRRMLDQYERALVFQLEGRWEESTTGPVMKEGEKVGYALAHEEKLRKVFNRAVVALERELFLKGYYKAFGLGAGPCFTCPSCNVPGPCINTAETRPSMEACGIDVYATMRKFGREITVASHASACFSLTGLVLIE